MLCFVVLASVTYFVSAPSRCEKSKSTFLPSVFPSPLHTHTHNTHTWHQKWIEDILRVIDWSKRIHKVRYSTLIHSATWIVSTHNMCSLGSNEMPICSFPRVRAWKLIWEAQKEMKFVISQWDLSSGWLMASKTALNDLIGLDPQCAHHILMNECWIYHCHKDIRMFYYHSLISKCM